MSKSTDWLTPDLTNRESKVDPSDLRKLLEEQVLCAQRVTYLEKLVARIVQLLIELHGR